MRNPFRFRASPASPVTPPERSIFAAIEEAATLDELAAAIRLHARSLTGADGVTIIIRQGDEVLYLDEDSIAPLWRGKRFPIHLCVSGLAMIERRPILIPDIYADKRVPHNAYLSTFVQSMALFPVGGDDPHMALGLYWRVASPVPAEAVAAMEALVERVAAALARIERDEAGRQVA